MVHCFLCSHANCSGVRYPAHYRTMSFFQAPLQHTSTQGGGSEALHLRRKHSPGSLSPNRSPASVGFHARCFATLNHTTRMHVSGQHCLAYVSALVTCICRVGRPFKLSVSDPSRSDAAGFSVLFFRFSSLHVSLIPFVRITAFSMAAHSCAVSLNRAVSLSS